MAVYPKPFGDGDQISVTKRAAAMLRTDETPRREIIEHARRSEVLSMLPKRTLRKLLRAADAIHVTRGITLGREGRPVDQVVVLAAGAAELSRDGRVVATLRPGDAYGMTEAMARRDVEHTLRTTEPCEVLVLRPQELTAILDGRSTAAIREMAATA